MERDALNYEKELDNKEEEFPLILSQTHGRGLPKLPLWVQQLYWYELNQMYPYKDHEKVKITLPKRIYPNPEKYKMKTVTGVATIEEFVEVVVEGETEDQVDIKAEVLRQYPDYVDFEIVEVKNAD